MKNKFYFLSGESQGQSQFKPPNNQDWETDGTSYFWGKGAGVCWNKEGWLKAVWEADP